MPIIRLQGPAEQQAGIYYQVDTDVPALGAGGMGQVYRGVRVDTRTGDRRPVAIKFLFEDLPANAIERSRREASIRIQSENLVEMYGFIEVPDPQTGVTHYHVVSELLEGVMLYDLLESGTFTDKLGREVPLAKELAQLRQSHPQEFATTIVKSVLSGVMAMHDRGFIHRDIDPSNIMITTEGRIKLIDYGIAKQIRGVRQEASLTSTGNFMGKAAYAAPELVTGDVPHQNETTDIYAIGIMLFQLLTGHLPFDGASHEILEKQMKKPLPLKEISNSNMRNVVDHATRKHQGERYLSAAEFRVDIERAERGQKTSPGMRTSYSGSSRSGQRSAFVIIGGIVAVVVLGILGALGYFVFSSMSDDSSYDNDGIYAEGKGTIPPGLKLPDSGTIVDSYDVQTFEYDGTTYKTVGKIVQEAQSDLNTASGVNNSVSILNEAVATNFKSASAAALQLSRIFRQDDLTPSQKSAVQEALGSANKGESYRFAAAAYQLDPENADVLYEMGNVYYGGPGYTGEMVQRDLDKALDFYKKSAAAAEASGNTLSAGRANQRISQLTALMKESGGAVAPAPVNKAGNNLPKDKTHNEKKKSDKSETPGPKKVYDEGTSFF